MAVDFDALCRDPIYRVLSTTATYAPVTGPTETIDVIDQTRGEVLHQGSADGVSVTAPTVHVKAGVVDDPAQGGTITINGVTYTIEGSQPIPGPGGEASGEIMLILAKT